MQTVTAIELYDRDTGATRAVLLRGDLRPGNRSSRHLDRWMRKHPRYPMVEICGIYQTDGETFAEAADNLAYICYISPRWNPVEA